MSRINPLYLVAFMLMMLFFVFFKLEESKSNQKQVREDFEKTNTLALDIVSLKKSWDLGSKNKAKLEKVLKASALRGVDIDKKYKRDSVTLSIKSLNHKHSEYLLNKLLNDSFEIKSMEIKRLNADGVSMKMEISL